MFPPAGSAPFSCLVLCRSHLLSSVTGHAWKSVYCVVNLIRNSSACMCITHPDMDTHPGVNSVVKADVIELQLMMVTMDLSSAAIKTPVCPRQPMSSIPDLTTGGLRVCVCNKLQNVFLLTVL